MLTKKEQRLRRARQTRIRIAKQGIARLTVNRTNLHIYATVISGDGSKVLATGGRRGVIARHAAAMGQHPAQGILRRHLTLARRLAIQRHRPHHIAGLGFAGSIVLVDWAQLARAVTPPLPIDTVSAVRAARSCVA